MMVRAVRLSLAVALVLLATSAVGLQTDIFKSSFTASLPAPSAGKTPTEASLKSGFEAAVVSAFRAATSISAIVSLTNTSNVTWSVQVEAIVYVPTSDESFDVIWQRFRNVQTNLVSSELGLSLNAAAQSLNGVGLTFPVDGIVVTYPCASTVGGICRGGTSATISFGVQLDQLVSSSQLQSSFCRVLGLSSCSELTVLTHTAGASGPTQATFQLTGTQNSIGKILSVVRIAHARSDPTLLSHGLSSLTLESRSGAGTVLFDRDEVSLRNAQEQSGGGDVPCELTDIWWLVILFAVIPLSLIVVRAVFRQGRLAGIERENKVIEDEKRREEQLASFLQSNPTAYTQSVVANPNLQASAVAAP